MLVFKSCLTYIVYYDVAFMLLIEKLTSAYLVHSTCSLFSLYVTCNTSFFFFFDSRIGVLIVLFLLIAFSLTYVQPFFTLWKWTK